MVWTHSEHQGIISERTWYRSLRNDELAPASRDLRHDHHAERATLRCPAVMRMRLAHGATDGNIENKISWTSSILFNDLRRKTNNSEDLIDKRSNELVKALVDVERATNDGMPRHPRPFNENQIHIARFLG